MANLKHVFSRQVPFEQEAHIPGVFQGVDGLLGQLGLSPWFHDRVDRLADVGLSGQAAANQDGVHSAFFQ